MKEERQCSVENSLTEIMALVLGVKQLHIDGFLLLIQIVCSISDQVHNHCSSYHRL